MEAAGRVLYAGSGVQVLRAERGRCVILRFIGTNTPELVRWLGSALKEIREPLLVNASALRSIDAAFAERFLDLAARKHPVAWVSPPPPLLDLLDQLSASGAIPSFSAEAALLPGGLSDSLAGEQLALQELSSRFRINPRWRKTAQDGVWLCALCGLEVDEVRIKTPGSPPPEALRRIRRHLLEECIASLSGRQNPLPASVLDAFLAEVNLRKAEQQSERRRRYESELETLQTRVESMEDLERSMDQAKRRQIHLLPLEPEADAVADLAVCYRPLQAVSGDFLDFYELEGDRFGAAIGDVSGHGVETAIVMGMAKMAFQVRSRLHPAVRDLLDAANRDLYGELRRTAFITGVFVAIERPTRRMRYARAGHPKPLLRRAAGGCEELEGQGLPLGVDRGARFAAALEEREAQLEAGDVLLLYTDGVIEAGPAASQFGLERLKEAVLKAPLAGTAREFLDSVTGALDAFLDGAPFGDDVTIVCLKIR